MSDESFEAQSSLLGVHVFLIADDPESRELLRTVLEYAGALVSTAASARAALGALHAIRPDVLVTDLAAEGEDGHWLIARVRALPWGADIPAVNVTRRPGREERRRALDAGFQELLVKPVDPWEMCRVVASLSRRSGS